MYARVARVPPRLLSEIPAGAINYVRKVFLNLKCVLNVLLMLYGDPKYLPRLDELINSTETAKQP